MTRGRRRDDAGARDARQDLRQPYVMAEYPDFGVPFSGGVGRKQSMITRGSDSGQAGLGILGVALVIWLVVGAIAGAQRHYYSGQNENCTHAGTIAVTILAGPLNYLGANPKVSCHTPQPSQ
jgi:hypothetical protein